MKTQLKKKPFAKTIKAKISNSDFNFTEKNIHSKNKKIRRKIKNVVNPKEKFKHRSKQYKQEK